MTSPRTRQRPGQATPDASKTTAAVIGPERTAGPRSATGPETGGKASGAHCPKPRGMSGSASGTEDGVLRWLAGELEAVAEMVHAARLSTKAGHIPLVQLRRTAVRLVALDAAMADTGVSDEGDP